MQFIEICWVFDVSVNFISFAMKASSSEYLESSSWTWLKGGSLNFKCIDMPDILTFNHLDNLVFWRLTVSDTTSYHSYQLRIHELSQDVWINSTYHSPPDFGLEGCDRSSLQMFERLPGRGRSQPAVNCVGLSQMAWARLGGLRWRPCPASLKKGIHRCVGFLILQIQICLTSLHDFQIELIAVDCHIYLSNSVC